MVWTAGSLMNSSSEREHCESAWEYRRDSTMEGRDSMVMRRAYRRSHCWAWPWRGVLVPAIVAIIVGEG